MTSGWIGKLRTSKTVSNSILKDRMMVSISELSEVLPLLDTVTQDRSYSFHDVQIAQEKNYYRLKELDLDGKFEYSKIILLKKALIGKEPFKVLTNPFAGNIDIELRDIERGKAIFRLFDMSGHQLLNRTELVNPISRIRLDVSSSVLPAGVYNLEMILNGRDMVPGW
jgi:hypothetical protein